MRLYGFLNTDNEDFFAEKTISKMGYSSNYFIRVDTDGNIRYSVPSSSLVLSVSLFWRY